MDETRPLFLQVASQLEGQIVDGSMAEETQVPSINELAAFNRINPATALKGVSLLVDAGVLYKRRGIGMFVSSGARARLLAARRESFRADFVRPLLTEATKLALTPHEVAAMIREEAGP